MRMWTLDLSDMAGDHGWSDMGDGTAITEEDGGVWQSQTYNPALLLQGIYSREMKLRFTKKPIHEYARQVYS